MSGIMLNFAGVSAATVPGAPTIGTATAASSTTATVVYTAPANNGGSVITSYTATSSPSGITGTLSQAGSGTITVTGLVTGTAYTFTVTATNAIGTSAASAASNSITPVFEGQLWIQGQGSFGIGTLGRNRTNESASSPIQVGSSTNWTDTAVSNYSALAVNAAGQLWSWGNGNGYFGQLGQNDTINRSSPTQVGALTAWQKISLGTNVSAAVKTDGTLWTWGRNSYGGGGGMLGQNDTIDRSSPVQVGSSTNWVSVSVSGFFGGTFAINSLGQLWAIGGTNNAGQLGLGDTVARSSPVQVGALTNWSNVFSSRRNCNAIKTDGTLWSWGRNDQGQLGQNNTIYRSSPTQVGSDTNWATLRKGNSYSNHGIKTNGTLFGWGQNNYGQLGLNDTYNRSSPVQVGALTAWSKVGNTGVGGCQAIKTDGTMWVWGANIEGVLGLNNTINRSSPVQLGSLTTWVIPGIGSSESANTSFIKTP